MAHILLPVYHMWTKLPPQYGLQDALFSIHILWSRFLPRPLCTHLGFFQALFQSSTCEPYPATTALPGNHSDELIICYSHWWAMGTYLCINKWVQQITFYYKNIQQILLYSTIKCIAIWDSAHNYFLRICSNVCVDFSSAHIAFCTLSTWL
jgi:hypothetical protein